MSGVTQEQIARAKAVPLLNYLLAHEGDNFKRVGSAYYRRDPDHNSLRVDNNLWYWHSRGIGGDIIDYLVKINGYSFVDAVLHLAGDAYPMPVTPKARPPTSSSRTALSSEPPKGDFSIAPSLILSPRGRSHGDSKEREPFRPPPRNTDNRRIIEYLQGRGIDKSIIEDCINRDSLYESGEGWHNCVFVGRDERGKGRFAAIRGSTGDFKRDANGSDKRFGFCIPADNPESKAVSVFESPIDCLSHKIIEPEFDGFRLSLGGTALVALTNFLERHADITSIIAATDNDDAGNRAAAEIAAKFSGRYEVSRSIPENGAKDWNEVLQKIKNEVKPLEDARKDIRFIDSRYNELFRIKDGENIKFTSGYDGKESIAKCRWIDECHTKIGSEYYHVDEWAEVCARNGHKIEQIPGQKPTIDILAAKYGEDLQAVSVPMTEAAIRKLVGGSYKTETLCYPNQTNQIKDRIVEIKGKAFGALVRGKDGIAVLGLGGPDNDKLTSLHPYNAQRQKRELSPAARAESEGGTLLGELAEAKAAVAGRAGNGDRNARLRPAEAR